MNRVKDKVALITGAAAGLGAATARILYNEGASVVVADINTEAGEALAQELGERALFIHLDVTDNNAWAHAMTQTIKHFGQLDVLVNNAGVVVMATIEDTTLEQLRFVQSVNIDGPFLGCQHAIPIMSNSGGGSIINISSLAGLVGTPSFAAYSASKGALRSITQTVAVHCKLRNNGIRCNSIHPGGIDTNMVSSLVELGEFSPLAVELLSQSNSALDNIGQPDDVAAAVLYFASDESKFVNGSMLAVDNAATAA